MSDYTPTTTEDIYSCFDYGYRNRSKVSFSVAKKAFDSWLAQHDAEVLEQATQRVWGLLNDIPATPWRENIIATLNAAIDAIRGDSTKCIPDQSQSVSPDIPQSVEDWSCIHAGCSIYGRHEHVISVEEGKK